MTERGTLEVVARHVGLATAQLSEALVDLRTFRTLMYRLGWDVTSLPPQYAALASKVDDVLAGIEGLGDDADIAEIRDLLKKIVALQDAVKGLSQAPSGAATNAFLAEITPRLFELLLTDYLAHFVPRAFHLLRLLGVIAEEDHEAVGNRPAFVQRQIRYDEIPKIVADPGSIPKRLYGWGTSDLDHVRLISDLFDLALATRQPASLELVSRQTREAFQESATQGRSLSRALRLPVTEFEAAGEVLTPTLVLVPYGSTDTKPPGLLLQPAIPSQIGAELELRENLKLRLRAASNIGALVGIVIRPGEVSVLYPGQPGVQLPSAGFGLAVEYAPPKPRLLLGFPKGSRLEIAGARGSLDIRSEKGAIELRVALALKELTAILSLGDQDGFLGKVLGGKDAKVPIPLGLGWSNTKGFEFGAAAGFEIVVAPHLQLGPISVDEVQIVVRGGAQLGKPPDLQTAVGVTVGGKLGPIAFAVQRMGVRLAFVFEPGNVGPFQFDVGFKPPTGVGLVVDGVVVKGGGFLSFDPENGEYAGVLELSLKNTIEIKAIGLLSTKLPGGEPGFSLLLIVTAQFPPIQLSFGFVLTGVGGLIGVNRTMVVDVLRTGIRTGTVSSIMFPAHPAENAPKIISDLKAVFPAAEGRFLFAPMVEIGWGTPALVKARLGIMVELPAPVRLVLLGQIRVLLPEEKAPLVRINLDALGLVEFERQALSLDATLYDSALVDFPLTGDMAMRLKWGEQPNFALAIGGLNPRFSPPPGFPELGRLTLTMGKGNNPRLALDAYTALTSNTVQFGANLHLEATSSGFLIRGHLGFDALISIPPFSFIADMQADVEIVQGGRVLMSVNLDLTLEGPSPWHAFGKARFKILFLTIEAGFDVRWGEEAQVTLAPVDVTGPLLTALGDSRNWSASLPPEAERGATLGPGEVPEKTVLVHPLGRLGVRQTVVPLNQTISRFGNSTPSGATRFGIDGAKLNGTDVGHQTQQEYFARGQFFELSDEERLSKESYERMDAGIAVGAASGTKSGYVSGLAADYETQIVENTVLPSTRAARYRPDAGAFGALVRQGAAELSPVLTTGDAKYVEPGSSSSIATFDQSYVIVDAETLEVRADIVQPSAGRSSVEATAKQHVADHPEEAGTVAVVPSHEAVAA